MVIPADLRRQYGLKPSTKVCFSAYDDGILIHSEDCIYNNDDSNENEKDLILSDAIVFEVLKIEADAIGVTLEEYVDRFLETFYKEPQKFYSITKNQMRTIK